MEKIYSFAKKIIANLSKDNVSEYSAQCAYYTILSFIPFIIILLTMIQYTGINQKTLFEVISRIIPSNMEELVLNIVQEVYSKSIGTISISIIFTLWSAGKGLYAFTKGLQKIYGVKNKVQTNYFYLRFKSIIQTIFFIILIVMALIVLVFGKTLISLLKEQFGILFNLGIIEKIFIEFGLITITFIIILILYKYMVKSNKKIKSLILGALFSAVVIKLVSFVFSIYLDIFKGFSITYGSLTTLMLIMMWTYVCFYIVFLGAEIVVNGDGDFDNPLASNKM